MTAHFVELYGDRNVRDDKAMVGGFALVYPLIQGREQGWPAWSFALLGGGVVTLGAFGLLPSRRSWLRGVAVGGRGRARLLGVDRTRRPGRQQHERRHRGSSRHQGVSRAHGRALMGATVMDATAPDRHWRAEAPRWRGRARARE